MPTFIDESGDPGPAEHSPRFFRLAAVWFETFDHTALFVESVARLRRDDLKVSEAFEFHFTDLSHPQRVAFFEVAAEHPFVFTACSFDKNRCDRRTLTKEMICRACLAHLTGELHPYYLLAEEEKATGAVPVPLYERVVFDESRDPDYLKLLKEGFKTLVSGRGGTAKLVKSVKPGKSKSATCIQLADMVCGAARLHLEGDSTYYNVIKKRALRLGLLRR